LLHGIDTPIACNCERFYRERGLFRQDYFYRRHHIAQMLLFGDAPCHDRSRQWIALFRSTGDSFSEAERQSLIAVWPHIVRAIKSNHRHYLERQVAERTGRAAALMNQEGVLEAEDAGFRAALLDEWPQFSEKRVPDAVLQCWYAGMTFIGERIRISMQAHREYVLCHAMRYSAPEALTRSERVVAYQFASGLSHKQIAKNLGVSQNTIRSHIAHAYEKLDVHNKASLANVLAAEPLAAQGSCLPAH
jgi:DNA-binding NarL/FixJ family response regulator